MLPREPRAEHEVAEGRRPAIDGTHAHLLLGAVREPQAKRVADAEVGVAGELCADRDRVAADPAIEPSRTPRSSIRPAR